MSNKLAIFKVYSGSNAEKAGITIDCTLVSYDGIPVTSNRELDNAIESASKSGKSSIVVHFVNHLGKNCQTEVPAGPLGILCVERSQVSASTENTKSGYGAALFIALITSFIGGLIVVGGIIAIIGAFATAGKSSGLSFIALLPAIGTIITGLLMVAAAQITRAVVDTANYSREIRDLLKRS